MNSTGIGMSCPVSGPNRRVVGRGGRAAPRGAGSSPARPRTPSGPSPAACAGAARSPRLRSRRPRAPRGRSAPPPRAPAARCRRRRGCGRPRRRRADEVPPPRPPAPAPSRRSRRCRRPATAPSCVTASRPAAAPRARDSGRAGTSGSPGRTRSGRPRVPRARPGRRRVVRGGEHLDAEPARTAPAAGTSARPTARRSGRRSRPPSRPTAVASTPKMSRQLALEPVPHRGAAEDVPVRAQQPPRRPATAPRASGPWPTPSASSGDPAGVQQPGDVVVRGDEQRRRIRERLVLEQQPRVDVAVRRDDRQVPHGVVEPFRDRADAGIRGQ